MIYFNEGYIEQCEHFTGKFIRIFWIKAAWIKIVLSTQLILCESIQDPFR